MAEVSQPDLAQPNIISGEASEAFSEPIRLEIEHAERSNVPSISYDPLVPSVPGDISREGSPFNLPTPDTLNVASVLGPLPLDLLDLPELGANAEYPLLGFLDEAFPLSQNRLGYSKESERVGLTTSLLDVCSVGSSLGVPPFGTSSMTNTVTTTLTEAVEDRNSISLSPAPPEPEPLSGRRAPIILPNPAPLEVVLVADLASSVVSAVTLAKFQKVVRQDLPYFPTTVARDIFEYRQKGQTQDSYLVTVKTEAQTPSMVMAQETERPTTGPIVIDSGDDVSPPGTKYVLISSDSE